MNSRRFATGLSALTLLAAAPLAAAMPATAADGGPGNGTASRSAKGIVSNTSTATCPAGQRAVSGGFRGPQGSTAILNRRTAADTWTVVSSDGQQQAYVYCSSTVAPTAVKATVDFPADNREPGVVSAICPQGRRAVAGGWEYGNQGTFNSNVFSSRPTANGRGWEVQAFTRDTDTLTAYAYCAPVSTVVRTASSDFTTTDFPGKGVAQVSCKPSEISLSGGFSVSPDADYYNDNGPDPFFYGSLRIGSASWKAQAVNYSSYNETDSTVTAYAVCTS